jgi:DNA alkylation repair enzyme
VTAAPSKAEPAGGFAPAAAAARVVAAMAPLADAERAAQAKAYLKSDLDFLGVSVPGIRQAVTAEARGWPELGRDGVLAWAQALWDAPVHERRTAAIEVFRRYLNGLEPADLAAGRRLGGGRRFLGTPLGPAHAAGGDTRGPA